MALEMIKGGFPLSQLSGGNLLGVLPPAFLVRITSVVTSTTVFIAEVLRDNGKTAEGKFPTNFFATGWKVRGVNCSNSANNGVAYDITASTLTGKLTTAACATAWVSGDLVMVCTDEYSDMLDTATALAAGNEFTLTKSVTKTALVTGGIDLTGVSTLDVSLIGVDWQNDSNVGGGATDGIFIITNDTVPLNLPVAATGTDVLASGFYHKEVMFRLAAGKKVTAKAVTANFSGTGVLVFHLTFRRNTVGSTIAAA